MFSTCGIRIGSSAYSNPEARCIVGAVQRDDQELLRQHLSMNKVYGIDDISTALHIAAQKGYTECARLLLDRGHAMPDIHNSSGATPLIQACRNGHEDMVRLLISVKCKMNKGTFSVRATALHWAATNGNLGCVELLLEAGCDPQVHTTQFRTPLMLAARSGHADVVATLIEAGASVNAVDCVKATALHYACEEGQDNCVRLLLKAGAKSNFMSKYSDTPLVLAAKNGHEDVVGLLLHRKDTDLSIRSRELSVLHWAALGGSVDCVQLLIKRGADPEAVTNKGYYGAHQIIYDGVTPLMLACSNGYSMISEFLINSGAKVERSDLEGNTPLLYAAKNNHGPCVEVLLKYGASPDGHFDGESLQIDEMELSPVFLAVKHNRKSALCVLLKANCNLNILALTKQQRFASVFEVALSGCHIDVCRMLMLAGYRVSIVNMAYMQEALATLLQQDEDFFHSFMRELQNFMMPSLMQLCRTCIRSSMGRDVGVNVQSLALPPAIKNYVALTELDDY